MPREEVPRIETNLFSQKNWLHTRESRILHVSPRLTHQFLILMLSQAKKSSFSPHYHGVALRPWQQFCYVPFPSARQVAERSNSATAKIRRHRSFTTPVTSDVVRLGAVAEEQSFHPDRPCKDRQHNTSCIRNFIFFY